VCIGAAEHITCWTQLIAQRAHDSSRGLCRATSITTSQLIRPTPGLLHSPHQACTYTALHSPTQPYTALHSPTQPYTAPVHLLPSWCEEVAVQHSGQHLPIVLLRGSLLLLALVLFDVS
jgi:hypothetical protein